MKYDIKNLTLEEKMKLLFGRNNWQLSNANGKLPDVFLSDGPHGLRMYDLSTGAKSVFPATAMPCLHVVANSWNTELAYLDGATIADECLEREAHVLLAPGVNMKRSPLCGRNFEYFSEDPLLAGLFGKAFIEGVQSKGVGTSLKHYCANNLEVDRLYQSSEVDERTLREIYLPAFEIAVEAEPWTVMCAYNPINGVYASENKWLLQDILRDEFGFKGIVVSDWGATHSQFRATKASLDLTMPYNDDHYPNLKNAYEKGWISEEEIDECVERILAFMEKASAPKQAPATTKEERHEIATQIAKEGMVLLKNEDNILPLKGGKTLIADMYWGWSPFGGGGSARVTSEYPCRRYEEILKEKMGDKIEIISSKTNISSSLEAITYHLKDTYQKAYGADTVLLFVGNNHGVESESYDRQTLRLNPMHEELIINTAKVNKNVVVVLFAGSAVDMTPWIDKVKGVLYAGFAGEGVQDAVTSILIGETCPSGKLSETFPLCLEDTPTASRHGDGFVDTYGEGIFIGYRWYDTKQKEVLFPFGHGLSYANFEYSNLQVKKITETDYEVSYDIKNLSSIPAKEVSQVYVKDVFAMVNRPEKELKGFAKTLIGAGETKTVTVKLNFRSFAYYSIPKKAWTVENGDFEILVGASSRDIRLMEKINICLPDDTQHSQE